ncbi:MAG TPA: zinc ribbon domain-containing protein [Candidatus Dormibacteraeota bacterium]|nr:zinc ribbon domain-containing protein [Candidatus Dormibacteraeota bacterium]
MSGALVGHHGHRRGRDRAGAQPGPAGPEPDRAASALPVPLPQPARLQAHIAALRRHEIPRLTTRLTTPHGRIVGEGLDAAGMIRQKGIPGARARRRGPAEAALAELRRQLRYQVGWYGSEVVEAERCFASSRTCHGCGLVQDLGGAEHWRGDGGGARRQRDDHAALNLWRGIGPGHPTKPASWGPR